MKHNPINQTAFDWLARIDAGLTVLEENEFEAWLASDNRHRGAYIRAKAVFYRARGVKGLSFANPAGRENVREMGRGYLVPAPDMGDIEEGNEEPVSRRRFIGMAGAAASVAGVAGFLFLSDQPAQAFTYRTRRGEKRNILLPDGTRVDLNTDSEMQVLFTRKFRTLDLTRGEALYNVAHDANRPFIVDAADFSLRTDDAIFAIRKIRGDQPELIVKKGTVELRTADGAPVRVAESIKLTFEPGKPLSGIRLSQSELDRELIWEQGKIAFEDTPLRQAISEFARYGAVHIRVEDPRLLDRTVTGVFSSDDPMGFARAVAEIFDMQAIPEGQGLTLRGQEKRLDGSAVSSL